MATDPPYLVNYTGGDHPDSKANRPETRDKDWDRYKDPESAVGFYVAFLEAALPHLIECCPVYQWHANTRQSLVDEAWQKTGLLAHQVIIWVKTRGVLTRSHYMWQHEPAMYGWPAGRMPGLKPPANSTTVWHVDQKGEQDGIHPTQKPVELFKRPLLYHTKKGDLCFEPFLGTRSRGTSTWWSSGGRRSRARPRSGDLSMNHSPGLSILRELAVDAQYESLTRPCHCQRGLSMNHSPGLSILRELAASG